MRKTSKDGPGGRESEIQIPIPSQFLHASSSSALALRHNLSRNATPRPDPLAIKQQDPGDQRQQRTDAAEQRTGLRVADGAEHLVGEEREDGGHEVPHEGLGGQGGRGVAVVDVGQVVEDGEVDDEDADLGGADGEDWGDPVD